MVICISTQTSTINHHHHALPPFAIATMDKQIILTIRCSNKVHACLWVSQIHVWTPTCPIDLEDHMVARRFGLLKSWVSKLNLQHRLYVFFPRKICFPLVTRITYTDQAMYTLSIYRYSTIYVSLSYIFGYRCVTP